MGLFFHDMKKSLDRDHKAKQALDPLKFGRKAQEIGRYIGTTGRGALRKVGDTARGVKAFAGKVNEATGGAAGLAWEASKSMPVVGAATTNIERGLNMAIKGSDMGLKAIDIGERASKIKGVGDAKSVYGDARSLYKKGRP
jgi:hypothetical protein